MRKIFLGILVIVVSLALSGVATAMLIPAAEQARDKAPLTPPGLEKVVFIHYEKGHGRICDNDGVCEPEIGENPSCADCKKDKEEPGDPDTSSCYAFLGRGVEWKELPVNYFIDPDNQDGLTEEFVISAISAGAEEWDNHTSADLFGTYTVDYNSSWDNDAPDNRNELVFGDYPQDGVIAVAIIWGYFGGRPSAREIVEFDVLFDTDFTWGDANIDETVMDLQNIATHEIGHGAGLGDLYDTVCAEETMYGYSNYGDIKKRDLNVGDIVGIQTLYGN